MISRRELFRALAATAVAAVAGSGAACSGGTREQLRLAAGEEGGFFWEFAQLTAAAAERADLGVTIVPLRTAGSIDNLAALASGEAELALSLADAAVTAMDTAAVTAMDTAAVSAIDAAADFTAIGKVYENYMQLAVRADSEIEDTSQLAGARISLGARGSGAELTAERILEVLGLGHPGDVTRLHLSMTDAGHALRDGSVDAVLWAGGVPTPSFANLGIALRLLDLSAELELLRQRFGPRYESVLIPPGTYGSQTPVATIGLANLLLAGPTVTDNAAGALVEVLIDHAAELVPEQATGSQFLDRQSLIVTAGVPLHPGAAAAYRRHHG
ncbi:TAXI family TRAP transporter solute-binding subunit [Rhodococcus sp. MSC1_016]|uniref:TAXI family TRAP transporter solute-binding subunit n=1 Tax=Rhodococcus sp. MSC1_016 TaxID=2909266 RepID=UPI00202F7DCC|nr:TAXI family TRAP transporter solute-binding subunit [Rhodococcus sp. MSC1_016]